MSILLLSAAVLLFLASLAAYAPFTFFLTDLFSHFVLQYAIGAIILILVTLLLARTNTAIYVLCVLSLILCLVQLAPFLTPISQQKTSSGEQLKILQANVLVLNTTTQPLQKLIAAENPDIVVIDEANSDFAKMAQSLLEKYPHQSVIASDDTAYGLAVLSRLPLKNVETQAPAKPYIPSQSFRVTLGAKEIDILSIHPANPLRDFKARDAELAAAAQWFSKRNPQNAIIIGDMNATPYCAAMKKLLHKTGLKNARTGFGILGSYSAWTPAFMRIPIDHMLVTGNAVVHDVRLGADIGSDHLPMVTSLSF